MHWISRQVYFYLLLLFICNDKRISCTISVDSNGPSFFQKIAGWIFPFGIGYSTQNDDIISESSNRIVKYQRPTNLILKTDTRFQNQVQTNAPVGQNRIRNQVFTQKHIDEPRIQNQGYLDKQIDEQVFTCSPCNKIPWIPIVAAFPPNGNKKNNKPLKFQTVQPTSKPFQTISGITTIDTIYGAHSTKTPNTKLPSVSIANNEHENSGNTWNSFNNDQFQIFKSPSIYSSTESPIKIISSIPIFLSSASPYNLHYQPPYTTTPSSLRSHTPRIHKYLSNISTAQNITFTTKRPPRPPGRITNLDYLPPKQVLPIESENQPLASMPIPHLSPTPVPPLYEAKPFLYDPYAAPQNIVKFIPVESKYTAFEPMPEFTKHIDVVTRIPNFISLPHGTREKVAHLFKSDFRDGNQDVFPKTIQQIRENEEFSTITTPRYSSPEKNNLSNDLHENSTATIERILSQHITTRKPDRFHKKTQFIVPYTMRQRPSPFRAKNLRKYEDITTPNSFDSTENDESDSQDTQESTIVTAKVSTLAAERKTTKYVAKILAASIKDLLLKEKVNTTEKEEHVPLDIRQTLQHRIDKWTEQQFGTVEQETHLGFPPMYSSTKSIPQEYITTSPLFPKVTIATVPPPATTKPTKRTTTGSRHRLTDTESLDYMLINKLKTNFNIAKASVENNNYQNHRLWRALQVSISPITKEKVYIVTPQRSDDEQSVVASSTPRFLIRPRPGTMRSDIRIH